MKQFRWIISLVAVLLMMTSGSFAQQKPLLGDDIVGVYWSPKKDAKISIYKLGGRYFGRSVWVASPRKDTENPEKALRTRDLLGLELFTNFRYHKGIYLDGAVYDPENGKTYECKMALDVGKLKVRGFIGFAIFGRTEIFERVK